MGLFNKLKSASDQSTNYSATNSANSNICANSNSLSTATTGYIGTNSPFTVGSGNSYAYGTSNYSTAWGIASDFFDEGEIFKSFIAYLNEQEINEFLEKLSSRNIDTDSFKNIVRSIVRNRHMSEDFLLDNFEKLTLDDIFRFHKSNIKSQEYARLALIIETSEKK